MFDNYFGRFQTFLYDVSDTITRSASMLLSRGIRIQSGEHPCTDGKSVITLPQAMKRRLAADEIDFVRYLLHHESAHIKHSDDVPHTCCRLHFVILNALEDIRIEKIERNALAGSNGIFSRGHRITQRIWDDRVKAIDPDKVGVDMGVVNAIFGAFIDPDRRTNPSGIPMLDWCMDCTRDFFPQIDKIGEAPYTTTQGLTQLALDIYRKFSQESEPTPEEEAGQKERESGDGAGGKSGGEDGSGDGDGDGDGQSNERQKSLAQDSLRQAPNTEGVYGEGMVEQAAVSIMTKVEERIDFNEIHRRCNSNAFGLSATYYKNERPRDSSKNWDWGRRACAGSGPLINLLRGQSRHALSTPKDSGIRIHQRSVPDFLNGLTNSVLRRRKVTPKVGTSVFVVVDDSGSMMGMYDRDAWRAASMLGHACERAQIKCGIARFSNQVLIEKGFAQSMASVRGRMGPFMGDGTHAVAALDVAHMQLKMQKTHRKVCFFICDGSTPDCRRLVRGIKQDGIEVYPILLGESAAEQAKPGGRWDMPGVAKIIDTQKHLASSLITRLVSVCK